MKSLETYYIGIDICKAKLDVYTRLDNQVQQVLNNPQAIDSFLANLADQHENIHIVCEATGGYEKPLLKAAFKAGRPISLVNPRCVRSFADAMSQYAKTDPIDAKMITFFAEIKKPSGMTEPTAIQEALQALSRRRSSIVASITQEKNALPKADNTIVKRDIRSMIRVLEGRLKKIENEMDKIVTGDVELNRKRERMEQIKGVGRVLSNALLAELPELGSITNKQASALVGVAPFVKDSGKHKGKRMIQGGRSQLRRSLYMGAFSASRYNKVLSEFYKRLTTKGKSHQLAVTAVMRKLVCLLNRLLADPEFKATS